MGYFIRFLHTIARSASGTLPPPLRSSRKDRRDFRANIAPFLRQLVCPRHRQDARHALLPRHPAAAVQPMETRPRAARRHGTASGSSALLRLPHLGGIISCWQAFQPRLRPRLAAGAMPDVTLQEENFPHRHLRVQFDPRPPVRTVHTDRVHALAARPVARPLRLPRLAGLDASRADRRDVDEIARVGKPGSRSSSATAATTVAG